MKLKSQPDDFCVEEITSVKPSQGPFSLYKLSKCGLGTPEAIQYILHKWQLPRNVISYGGMKDRHARTIQYLSIHRGPRSGLTDKSFGLDYLGACPRPYNSKDIVANRFHLRLRGIAPGDIERLSARCEMVADSGVINYFDDQRFGSIGYCGEIIAVPWCQGNYERTLYLAMAEPNSHDRPREKDQKQILRDYWGQWEKCKAMLDRSHRRSVVTYLVDHPTDFRRAVALIRQDLRGIYVAAFQSWVWNRWVSALIESKVGANDITKMDSKCGPLNIPCLSIKSLGSEVAGILKSDLPLPSARQHDWPAGTLDTLHEVLAPLQMDVKQMRLKYPRDTFFSRGFRPVTLRVQGMQYGWEDDTLNPGMKCLKLSFDLIRGAYATMVVRCLFAGQNNDASEMAMGIEEGDAEGTSIEGNSDDYSVDEGKGSEVPAIPKATDDLSSPAASVEQSIED